MYTFATQRQATSSDLPHSSSCPSTPARAATDGRSCSRFAFVSILMHCLETPLGSFVSNMKQEGSTRSFSIRLCIPFRIVFTDSSSIRGYLIFAI